MTIGDRIRNTRKQMHITQEELAKSAGTSKQTIQRYEAGIISNIPSDKIEMIAIRLNVTPQSLMGWDTEDNKRDELIDIFESLSSENKEKVKEFMEFLLSKE